MIIQTSIKIRSGIKVDLMTFPNFSIEKQLVPSNITIYDVTTSEKILATNITVKLYNNGLSIFDYQEPYFHLYNSINLSDFKSIFNQGLNLELLIMTSSKTWAEYLIEVEYVQSNGIIIYQQKTQVTDKIFKEICDKGVCTQLIISFNKNIKNLKIASVFKPVVIEPEEQWFYPIEIAESDDNSSMIDLIKEHKIYSRYLSFMKLMYDPIVIDETDTDDDPLYIYITAYGFMRS